MSVEVSLVFVSGTAVMRCSNGVLLFKQNLDRFNLEGEGRLLWPSLRSTCLDIEFV